MAVDEDYLNCLRTEVSPVNIPELWNLLKHQIQIPGPQHPNPITNPNPEYPDFFWELRSWYPHVLEALQENVTHAEIEEYTLAINSRCRN